MIRNQYPMLREQAQFLNSQSGLEEGTEAPSKTSTLLNEASAQVELDQQQAGPSLVAPGVNLSPLSKISKTR